MSRFNDTFPSGSLSSQVGAYAQRPQSRALVSMAQHNVLGKTMPLVCASEDDDCLLLKDRIRTSAWLNRVWGFG